ncbi:MAG: hypothetical protein JWL81_3096 [Verrucomicrobiales bacterium]|nr:hypothetical protein [Verrucomicrobiales bacterium]
MTRNWWKRCEKSGLSNRNLIELDFASPAIGFAMIGLALGAMNREPDVRPTETRANYNYQAELITR